MAELSELYPKPSKKVQATLHGTPLLQCTHEWVSQNSHSARQAYQRDVVFPPETEQCPDKTLDKPSLLLLALKPGPKCHIWKNRMGEPTSIRGISICLPCFHQCRSNQTLGIARRWCLPMPPVVPDHRPVHFPSVLREMKSTSTSPQFRSGTGCSTVVYIHTPEGESDVQFS
jgi:hypothetical protein